MGVLSGMDTTGDTKLTWNPQNADETGAAKKMFEDLKSKGFTAYSTNDEGDKGEVIQKFDPAARRIIMAPRMVGG